LGLIGDVSEVRQLGLDTRRVAEAFAGRGTRECRPRTCDRHACLLNAPCAQFTLRALQHLVACPNDLALPRNLLLHVRLLPAQLRLDRWPLHGERSASVSLMLLLRTSAARWRREHGGWHTWLAAMNASTSLKSFSSSSTGVRAICKGACTAACLPENRSRTTTRNSAEPVSTTPIE
jgi:hypothetical protein